jgi:hypothetical protein
LLQKYQEFLGNNLPFEIVFATTDADEQDFNSNRADMPWLAVSFKDRNVLLKQVFSSGSISTPTLIIYDNLGESCAPCLLRPSIDSSLFQATSSPKTGFKIFLAARAIGLSPKPSAALRK